MPLSHLTADAASTCLVGQLNCSPDPQISPWNGEKFGQQKCRKDWVFCALRREFFATGPSGVAMNDGTQGGLLFGARFGAGRQLSRRHRLRKPASLSAEDSMSLSILLTALAFGAGAAPQLDPTELGVPFQRYTATDGLGRTITFYLSLPANVQQDAKLPVALIIQGSGCQSLFRQRGEQLSGGEQNLLHRAAMGKLRVLAVEKPGVKFLDSA